MAATHFSGPVYSAGGFVGGVTLSAPVVTAAGTAAAPGFTFTGDTDNGMYLIAANNPGISAAGAKVLDISAAGLGVTGAITATTSITSTGNLISTAYIQRSCTNALTAAGTTRTDALQLAAAINRVTTAASGTGVTLPSAATVGIGGFVYLYNAGANAIKVYGAGSDTIDGTTGSTGVTLTNALRCAYTCVAANTWISSQLGVVSA